MSALPMGAIAGMLPHPVPHLIVDLETAHANEELPASACLGDEAEDVRAGEACKV